MPTMNCPSCKAPNEVGTLMCKKCGDILTKKAKPGKKSGEPEFDATEGSFSPTCVVVPLVIISVIFLILFFSFKGSSNPCAHNREVIGLAIMKYEKENPNDKLSSVDFDKLLKAGPKGKPYLKEKLVCPFDSSATYEYDGKIITCTKCSKKKK